MLTITITKPDDVPVLFDTLRQMLAATMPAPFVYPADAPADVVTGPVTLRDHARAAAQATAADLPVEVDVVVKRGPGRPRKNATTEPAPLAADEQTPAPGAVEADLQAGGVEVAPEPEPVVEETKAEETKAEEPPPPAEKLTFDALKARVAAFAENAEKGGGARLRALLTEFGVARISELPEARWVEFAGRVAL